MSEPEILNMASYRAGNGYKVVIVTISSYQERESCLQL